MQMTLDELAVGQVEGRRIHLAMNHAYRVTEEILVVGRLSCTVGNDQRGLSGTTGTTATLSIIGRRRRDVAQIDGIQRRNVDPKFHGW